MSNFKLPNEMDAIYEIEESLKIGETIEGLRVEKGLSQTELAEMARISVSYLSLIENSKKKPTLQTLESISNALDLPIYVFLLEATLNSNSKDESIDSLREALKPILKRITKRVYANDKLTNLHQIDMMPKGIQDLILNWKI